jgi:DNA-binding NarL/FixJ family response regulator
MDTFKKNIKVLLVDDHKSFSDGLAMLINTNKPVMQVVGTASNRQEALNSISQNKPDVVLLDVDMGKDNGIDMLPELLSKFTEAKFIVLTGEQSPSVHQQAILNGARGVLLKTDSAQTILKAIEKVYSGELWLDMNTMSNVLSRFTGAGSKGNNSQDREARKIADLTDREREIVKVLVQNDSSTNEEIADSLFIANSTLKNHLTAIYSKLEIRNRIELLKYALKHNLDK